VHDTNTEIDSFLTGANNTVAASRVYLTA